jgi:hypothetical protein
MAIAPISAASAGDNAVVAAVTGKKVRVRGYALYNGVATARTRSGAPGRRTSPACCTGRRRSV